MHATFTVVRACLFFIGRDTTSTTNLYTTCTQPVHHLYTTCTPPVHHLYTTCTPPVHNLYYQHVTYLFQGVFQPWQPCLHQMNVLQKNPTATFTEFMHAVFGTVFLALPHGNVEKFFVGHVFRVFLHPPSGVHAGKQREEDGGGGAGFIDGFSNVERGLPNVFGPNVRFHKTRQLRRQSIRSHQSNDQQAVKA
jgi:hypothetical protein